MNDLQVVICPVQGGKLIIHQSGDIFRVFLDLPECVVELSPHWIYFHYTRLQFISLVASRIIHRHGLEVEVYG